jgi:outer membrane putative beta-barrel porin/alpha-amylase
VSEEAVAEESGSETGALRRCLAPVVFLLIAGSLSAQDLDPRAYGNTPLGTNVAVGVYSRLSGDVLFDPSLPVEDVHAGFNVYTVGYYRSLNLFGRSANVRIALPYLTGKIEGLVQDVFTSVDKSGFADVKVQAAINLLGGPVMTLQEFRKARPTTNLFASFTVSAPTGVYDSSKLINIGNNRWAFKPEFAVQQPLGKWTVESYIGAWFFTTNHEFYGGRVRAQNPMFGAQIHVSYTFRPGLWVAADGTYYTGGETTINGVDKHDLQHASRAGVTGSWAFAPGHAIKAQYARTTSVRVGGKFNLYSLAYAFTWFDKRGGLR